MVAVLTIALVAGHGVAMGATDATVLTQQEGTPTPTTNETATATPTPTANPSVPGVAPGERLTGILGVQGAELDREVEERTFGLAIAGAATDEERAEAIAERVEESNERLADLREERAELREERAEGDISEGAYQAQIARLATQIESVERASSQSQAASENVSAAALGASGVDRAAIEQLRTNASSLSGPEVAAIARTTGGPPDGVRGGDEATDAEDEQRESDDDESETTPEAGAGDGNETSTNETEAEETAEPGAGQGNGGDAGSGNGGGGGIYTLGGVGGDR